LHQKIKPELSYKKAAQKMLVTWGQFHQRSTRSLYIRKFCAQLFCANVSGLNFTGAKDARRTLMKLNPGRLKLIYICLLWG
jgi:hypothetical protein